ncbi:hypothetical protein ACA910_000226 [Epithemia clementina (nom. ined.)]
MKGWFSPLLLTSIFCVPVLHGLEDAWKRNLGCPSSSWGLPKSVLLLRGGDNVEDNSSCNGKEQYGRISHSYYRLTPDQIELFHREGCVTIPDLLSEEEILEFEALANSLLTGEIHIPGKDFCDISKKFGVPMEDWSLVNAMLPSKYCPILKDNIYERLTRSMAQQLFPDSNMTMDYDQLLNKKPGKDDAVFAWHQDMAYWPGSRVLGVNRTDTCTFSLALDDSDEANGCLRYVVGSGVAKTLREHRPLCRDRDEGHAVTVDVHPDEEEIRLAPAKRGSITIHDEYVVHGSGGNTCQDRQRRTYVIAYRAHEIVAAERRLGFTHSHNDEANWDTFQDGESHRVKGK